MRSFLRFAKWAVILVVGVGALLFLWLRMTMVAASDLPRLRDGDIVFQTIDGSQTLAILLASRSPYSHVGMVRIAEGGTPMVVEAVGPVREIALDQWIEQGIGGRITVKRMEALTPEQARSALDAASVFDGRPYDIYFRSDDDAIYCSELVRNAFLRGPKIELGRLETIRELNIDNFAARKLVDRRWSTHPDCMEPPYNTRDSCFARILDQELVTPDSIAADAKLTQIYSNFGLLAF
jgi:hypothetical protein